MNFALNKTLITDLAALKTSLTASNMRLVAFIDSTIFAPANIDFFKTENVHYLDGDSVGAFIKSTHFVTSNPMDSKYHNNLVGILNDETNQQCVYIDWFNFVDTPVYWRQRVEKYFDEIQFDGLWTTGNEPYST